MAKKLTHAVLIAAGASVVALACWLAGLLNSWEYGSWSLRVRHFMRPSPSTDRIKLILLDQASLDWGARENGLPWPWPRSVYVPIIDFCVRGGAKAIAFDVLYTEGSGADLVSEDVQLGAAVARAGNFVAAVYLGEQARQTMVWPDAAPGPRAAVAGLDAWLERNAANIVEPGAAFPIPEIATQAAMLANVKDIPDDDGVFRRATLFRVFDGRVLPSLGLATFLMGRTEPLSISDGVFTIGDIRIPIDNQARAILNFRGPSGTHQAFSAAAIIQSELRLQEGESAPVDPSVFKNCYVFFGFSAPGLKDLRPTPVSGDYPGVEIHATFLDNLLERSFLREANRSAVAAVTVLLALLASLAVVLSRNAWQSVVAFVVFLPIPAALGFVAYPQGVWWDILAGELAVALSLVGGVVLNYATEGRQKRFIKSAFNQYVGEEVLDELVRDPSKLKLGGEKRELTMFFSDLEKFSSFSERLDPPQLIELLNVYLTEMGQIIKHETGGFLDKFVGDAIVAFWNAPVAQPDHAARAVRAALLCQRRLAQKRDAWAAQYHAVLRMRIGIGTGEVVVGNMGSADKFNYTMLGDAANAASRLEGANKAFGTYTMVADVTWQQAKSAVLGRELGAIRVVGRKTPMNVYEPLALAGESLPAWAREFERGVALCRGRQWKDALAVFEKISDDRASEIYAQRCRDLISGALKEWDGVWNLTEK